MKVTIWAWNGTAGFNQVAIKLLRSLGYRVVTKRLPGAAYFNAVADSRNRAQLGFTAWTADYPTASDFFYEPFRLRRVPSDDPAATSNFAGSATRASTG